MLENETEPAPRRMTFDEWVDLDEDEPGELVNGQLVEGEMPSFIHELVILWLGRVLLNWGSGRGVFVGGSGAKFRVTATRGRMPDITVYLPEAGKPQAKGLITKPPSIVVEVVSPTARDERRDRVEKLAEYAAFGVRWYWLVDPALRTFEIFELGSDGRYVHALGVTEGLIAQVPGCDGLQVNLSELWTEIDRLEA